MNGTASTHIKHPHAQPNEVLIEYIAVSPHARGRGLGHELLRWAEHRAPHILNHATKMCPLVTLWVRRPLPPCPMQTHTFAHHHQLSSSR